jgi:hypothetical protein
LSHQTPASIGGAKIVIAAENTKRVTAGQIRGSEPAGSDPSRRNDNVKEQVAMGWVIVEWNSGKSQSRRCSSAQSDGGEQSIIRPAIRVEICVAEAVNASSDGREVKVVGAGGEIAATIEKIDARDQKGASDARKIT